MPLFQGIIFQEGGGAGWSSVYYISAADHAGALVALQALNTSQLGIQAASVSTNVLRVSDVSVKGDGMLAVPTTPVGQLSMTANKLAPLDNAAHFEFWTADRKHRVNKYIHGLRLVDLDNDGSGRAILASSYTVLAAITTYINDVIARAVNWQGRSLPPVTAPLTAGAFATFVSTRRVGRPFFQPRGRRRVA